MKINIQIEDASPEELQRLFYTASVPFLPKQKEPVQAKQDGITTAGSGWDCKTTTHGETTTHTVPTPTPIITVIKAPKVKPAAKAKKPKDTVRSGNRYGIPAHLFSEDKRKYQRIWSRCKTRGIMYEEALKLEGKPDSERVPKPDPAKPTPPEQERVRNAIVAKNGSIKAGQFVKHNGAHSSPFFGQVGEVLKVADTGEIFVKFGSSTTWIPQYIVMVVPEAKE